MLELPVNDEQRQRLWHIKVASLRACKIIKDNIENLISLIKLQRPSIYDIKLTKEKKLLKEVSFFLWCFSIVDSSSVSHTNLISFFVFFNFFSFLFLLFAGYGMKLLIFLFFSCPVYGLTKYSLTTLLTLEGNGEKFPIPFSTLKARN